MKEKNYYIYSLSDPNSGEIRYIGKTSNISDRFKRHLQKCYLDNYDKNTYKSNWIKSLLEKGLSPIIEIVEECNKDNVNKLEIYWISQFRAWGFRLTNLSEGGEIGVDWTGRKHTSISKEKIHQSKIKYMTPIVQYDLNGNILNEYESLMEASIKSGYHIYLISNCCKKKSHYTVGGGHFWRKENELICSTFRYKGEKFEYTPYNKTIQKNSKRICKYSMDGSFLKTYESTRASALDVGSNKSNISSCCKRKINKKTGRFIIVNGFTWRYYDETNGKDLNY